MWQFYCRKWAVKLMKKTGMGAGDEKRRLSMSGEGGRWRPVQMGYGPVYYPGVKNRQDAAKPHLCLLACMGEPAWDAPGRVGEERDLSADGAVI